MLGGPSAAGHPTRTLNGILTENSDPPWPPWPWIGFLTAHTAQVPSFQCRAASCFKTSLGEESSKKMLCHRVLCSRTPALHLTPECFLSSLPSLHDAALTSLAQAMLPSWARNLQQASKEVTLGCSQPGHSRAVRHETSLREVICIHGQRGPSSS